MVGSGRRSHRSGKLITGDQFTDHAESCIAPKKTGKPSAVTEPE